MSRAWQKWREVGAPAKLVQILRFGVPLPFASSPPKSVHISTESQALLQHVTELVEWGAYSEISNPHIVTPMFTIKKRDGSLRGIHDLRVVNNYLPRARFSIHGIRDTIRLVRAVSFGCTLDLKKGYYQVLMAPDTKKFLATRVGGKTVAAEVLPFGLSLAPFIFQKLTSFVARLVREYWDLQVVVYLDDFLIGHHSRTYLEGCMPKVLTLLQSLGMRLSEKTIATPATELKYLGLEWNLVKKTVAVPLEKRQIYLQLVKALLKGKRWSKYALRELIGKLNYISPACPLATVQVREMQRALRKFSTLVEMPLEVKKELAWWAETLSSPVEASIRKKLITASINTDALSTHLGYTVQVGDVRVDARSVPLDRLDRKRHINYKELQAVKYALLNNLECLQRRRAIVWTDNVTVAALLRKGGSTRVSSGLQELIKETLHIAANQQITLTPRVIPGALNVEADQLSRPSTEWSVPRKILSTVVAEIGPLQVDRFGSLTNTLLRQFDTRESDTFTTDWRGRRNWVVPPIALIEEVVDRIVRWAAPDRSACPFRLKSLAVVVTPSWRRTNWALRLSKVASRTWRFPLSLEEVSSMGELARISWSQRSPAELIAWLVPLNSEPVPPEHKIED